MGTCEVRHTSEVSAGLYNYTIVYIYKSYIIPMSHSVMSSLPIICNINNLFNLGNLD